MRFFNLERKESSASDSCLKSCASSSLKITSCVVCSFCLASERKELAHAFSALDVEFNL
jgi:hypothetical protein